MRSIMGSGEEDAEVAAEAETMTMTLNVFGSAFGIILVFYCIITA